MTSNDYSVAARIYAESFSSSMKDDYRPMMPAENFVRIFRLFIEGNLPTERTPRCLDVGLGEGRHLAFLLSEGFECTGTEVSEEGLVLAKKVLGERPGYKLYRVEHGESLPNISDSPYDLILCWETLHWFGHRDLIAEQLDLWKTALQENGRIVVTFPAEEHYLIVGGVHLGENLYLCEAAERKGAIIFGCSYSEYTKMFLQSGLRVRSVIKYTHGRRDFEDGEVSFSATPDHPFAMYAFVLSAL